jgi:hypothetical protein
MVTNVIALYPGRFQPFGKHHAAAFKWLQTQFRGANCYILTSIVVDPPKSPFSFKEKSDIIRQYGFDDRLVQVKNPYKSEEILTKLDPKNTAVVFMIGAKDMKEDPRFRIGKLKSGKDSYFQEYAKNKRNLKGFDEHGYLVVAPHVSMSVPGYGEMSGTSLRKALGAKIPRSQKINLFKAVFGWYDKKTADMIFDKLESLSESKIHEIMKKKNSIQIPESVEVTKLFSKDWWAESLNLDEDEKDADDPCWKGYRQYGMKKKNGKEVPNCVPESVEEGYMNAKVQAKHNAKMEKLKTFLHNNTGKPFVYDFNEFPKTVYGVPREDLEEPLIMEGGAGGHMAHVFDIEWVKTGKDLLTAFQMSIDYLKKGPAAVKIDGVNASIRLITLDNKKQFVMDRGSNKPLDVKGITKAELEDRFGPGHGMIKVGGTVLDIFNEALPDITPALKKLGLWDNPNILFNLEYVAGSTNVLAYNKNFIAVHGLLEITQVTPTKRATKEKSYSKVAMKELLNNLAPTAEKYGYEVVGAVPTKLDSIPNLDAELNQKYTVNIGKGKEVTKTLKQWLMQATIPEGTIKTKEGKTISPLSKDVLLKLSDKVPLTDYLADPKDYKAAINGFVIYLATMKLGDVILNSLSPPLGPVSEHEGIVIRDKQISNKPFKITGKFILGGLASSFNK